MLGILTYNTRTANELGGFTVLKPIQGGTGISSTVAGNVGAYLSVASTSPYLALTFSSNEKCYTYWPLEYPTSTANYERQILSPPIRVTSTITYVSAVNWSAGDTVTFNLFIGSNAGRSIATSSMNQVFTSYQTSNSTSTEQSFTINGSTTIGIGQFLMTDISNGSSTRWRVGICLKET